MQIRHTPRWPTKENCFHLSISLPFSSLLANPPEVTCAGIETFYHFITLYSTHVSLDVKISYEDIIEQT